MNNRLYKIRYLAAGSLMTVAIALLLLPFNLGGCSMSNMNVGQVFNGAVQATKGFTRGEEGDPALGQAVAVQVTHKYPLYRNETPVPDTKMDRGQALDRYITLVGRTVAAASSRSDLTFYFGVVETDEVNAFSGPGGYVFITRGTLRRLKDESELAGVLGHEIGHICKHHGREAVKQADLKQGLITAASGASKEFAQFSGASDFLGEKVLNVGFGEPQELEADAEGVKYAIGAGYNPDGYLHFMQRLVEEQGAGGKPFSTHPGLGDRVKKISDQIDKAGAGGKGATLAERFAMNVKFAE